MRNKSKDKKAKVTKKRVSTSLLAEVVECSDRMVRMVRSDARNADTTTGQKIEVADMLLEEGLNKLITEVKKIVKI